MADSGIYDSRGRPIENAIERTGGNNTPDSEDVTGEGNPVLSDDPGAAFRAGNYRGNIIIKDNAGTSVISILKEGTILVNDGTTNRILIGKQAGGF